MLAGKASVVTDHIDTFTERGVRLKSGDDIEADIIVTATGLVMQAFGGIDLTVDSRKVKLAETLAYKGVMFAGIPNLAVVFGYINASWTLKADLICQYVCRMLNYMDRRGAKKVVRVTIKPPPVDAETLRVRKLMCADFLWEVNRIKNEAGIRDLSMEVMPYISAHMYVGGKNLPPELEEKFWDEWPSTLKKVVERCEKDELKFYFTEVLVPALDGTLPSRDTVSAAAAP